MPSLTSLIPTIAPFVGVSAGSLYERQRALVRLKLLPKPVGRGRGSGANATPENVALLLISMLVTDSLAETDSRIETFISLPINTHRKRKQCALTKATTFGQALTAILAEPWTAAKVSCVSVGRKESEGAIYWERAPRQKAHDMSLFREPLSRSPLSVTFSVTASLRNPALRQLAAILTAIGSVA